MFFLILSFVFMLLFPQETLYGAGKGLLLWFQTLLPTLLPFIILSNLLIKTGSAAYISHAISPLLRKLFRITEPACYAVLVGFLCGYPMGAKVISDLLSEQQISTSEAKYLLSFCNNTSPMFIISFIVMQNFKNESLTFCTLIILIIVPVLCSFLFRKKYHFEHSYSTKEVYLSPKFTFHFDIFDASIMNGFETITKIGGYVILFSILLTLCRNLPIYTPILSILEISNGIPMIIHSELPLIVSYPAVLGLTAFGGLCAIAQTYSMIQKNHLPIIPYIIQKLITATVTSLFAIVYILFIHR